MALRIVFMGTAELACASLEALHCPEDFQVVLVVTQPDRPGGRKLQLQPSPVKRTARALQLPLAQPDRARDESFIGELQRLKPDLIVVAAYGQILPESLLCIPKHGCINVHTSLLPKYRGASPIQSAILHGEAESGVTIMQIDAGLDTGPILSQQSTPIADDDDAATLHDRLAQIGAELLVRTIPDFISGKITPQPQPAAGVSHTKKIRKQDGLMDWKLPARELWNRIRAFTPWPGAFTRLQTGNGGDAPTATPAPLLKIWKADPADENGEPGEIVQADKAGIIVACGQGALRIAQLQLEGGRALTAAEFLAGHPLRKGQRLG